MTLPKGNLVEFIAYRLEPRFRAFPGDFPIHIATEIAKCALEAQKEFMEAATTTLTEKLETSHGAPDV